PIHPIYPRVITVREAARLHSYPDWFRFHVTKWHGFRQVGNSVPPMLARSVGLQIMKVLGVTPKKPTKKIKLGDESLVAISMSDAASMFGVSSNVIAKRIKNSNKEVVCE
ncbi:DNA cytosine methyltransferase, partial [Klebsiella pneumoniae]